MLEMMSQPIDTVFFVVYIQGFGDSVAIEDKTRAGTQSHGALRIIAADSGQAEGRTQYRGNANRLHRPAEAEDGQHWRRSRCELRIEHSVDESDEFPRGKVLDQQAVQLGQHFARSAAGFGQGAHHAARRRHEESGGGAFS